MIRIMDRCNVLIIASEPENWAQATITGTHYNVPNMMKPNPRGGAEMLGTMISNMASQPAHTRGVTSVWLEDCKAPLVPGAQMEYKKSTKGRERSTSRSRKAMEKQEAVAKSITIKGKPDAGTTGKEEHILGTWGNYQPPPPQTRQLPRACRMAGHTLDQIQSMPDSPFQLLDAITEQISELAILDTIRKMHWAQWRIRPFDEAEEVQARDWIPGTRVYQAKLHTRVPGGHDYTCNSTTFPITAIEGGTREGNPEDELYCGGDMCLPGLVFICPGDQVQSRHYTTDEFQKIKDSDLTGWPLADGRIAVDTRRIHVNHLIPLEGWRTLEYDKITRILEIGGEIIDGTWTQTTSTFQDFSGTNWRVDDTEEPAVMTAQHQPTIGPEPGSLLAQHIAWGRQTVGLQTLWMLTWAIAVVCKVMEEETESLLSQFDLGGRRERFDPRVITSFTYALGLGFESRSVKDWLAMCMATQAIYYPVDPDLRTPPAQRLMWRKLLTIITRFFLSDTPWPEFPRAHVLPCRDAVCRMLRNTGEHRYGELKLMVEQMMEYLTGRGASYGHETHTQSSLTR